MAADQLGNGARPLVALALALVLLLPGCLGSDKTPAAEGPRLAQPTDKPAELPTGPNITGPEATDFSDAGYLMPGTWSVGDEWHYRSNQTRYKITKILREGTVDGERMLVVQDQWGWYNMSPQRTAIGWVYADTLLRTNLSYATGLVSYEYDPGMPERFLRNGTYSYNESEFSSGVFAKRSVVRANSFVAGYEKVPLLWDRNAFAGRVEHRILKTDAEGVSERLLEVRFPHRDYGNDVQYQENDGELYRLVHVKYASLNLGKPLSWPQPDEEEDEDFYDDFGEP